MAVDDINQLNLNEVLEMIKKDENGGNDIGFPERIIALAASVLWRTSTRPIPVAGLVTKKRIRGRRTSVCGRNITGRDFGNVQAVFSSSRSRPRQRRCFLLTVSPVESL